MSEEYETIIDDDRGMIILEGDFDNEQAGELYRRAFNKIFDRGHRTVILDFSNVQIINSYGIGKILMTYKRLKAEGGVMKVRPLSGFGRETFELLMLDTLFPVDQPVTV